MEFYIHVPPPVYYLDATQAFDALTPKEQQYIYACYQACWIGGLIDLIQTSPESAAIFLLVNRVFSVQSPDEIAEVAKSNGFSDDEIEAIFSYFATVCGNLGNYLSFGDTKFVPSVSRDRLVQFLSLTSAFADKASGVETLLEEVSSAMYSLAPRRLRLGFGPTDGISTYYSGDCTRTEAEAAQAYLKANKLEAYNTRVFKDATNDENSHVLTIRFASSEEKTILPDCSDHVPSNWKLRLQSGDFSELMSLLVTASREAQLHALNPNETEMWGLYADSFLTGCIDKHKDGSRAWVRDKNPVVENYIGFIETYRDPLGVRAEFEGFVAVVNKIMSAKFQLLVEHAVDILKCLPWPASYERDRFTRPDFTSLDVVSFACSGIPLGINIPNYDEIREATGFKNVSLGNVLSAKFKDQKAEFLSDTDKPVFLANVESAFEIQVGLHELLGHGSGKLFRRNEDGTYNFDVENTKDFITGGPVQHWYEPGENWDNKFASLSSAMEECRAECVGLYLCDLPIVLKLFGVGDECQTNDQVSDVVYINWLSMVRLGIMAMEFYTPPKNEGDAGAWRQAHCHARYTILRVLLEADASMVRVQEVVGDDGAPDLLITLERDKLATIAKPAIGQFLGKLQYYRSTGNAKDGCSFFLRHSEFLPEHSAIRDIVLARKRPRAIFVQPNLRKDATGEIHLVPYAPTYRGLLQSFVDRYSELPLGKKALIALESVWRKDQPYFKDIPL
ncbi:unnamed protein product [Dicrocoelium dendriticum]|nr:unnamed protein product [Dicrocoelium dendriticum]